MNGSAFPDLSARELQAICTIAEYRSFNAAALTLNVSQPALTRTLKRVERALGVELFRRSTRKVDLTPAGQEFIALANRILADLRLSYANMRDIADEQRGRIIVSAVISVACTRLPELVAGYRSAHPDVEIQLREGVHGAVLDDVRAGVADFGITYLDEAPAEFICSRLCRETFYVVMPRDHALAARKSLGLSHLAGVPLVSLPLGSQTRRSLDGCASLQGTSLKHAVTVTQFATAMRCVQAGVGLCVVPGGAIATAASADLVSRPLTTPRLRRTLGAAMLRDRSLTPNARGLLSRIEAHWTQTGTSVRTGVRMLGRRSGAPRK